MALRVKIYLGEALGDSGDIIYIIVDKILSVGN
jgi:hypothetical protein